MNSPAPRVYLLDIEGTVAPISFVYEQLFPYARANFAEFLAANQSNLNVAADLTLLATENCEEKEPGCPTFATGSSPLPGEEAVSYLNWLMDRDRKSTALKSLQGKIWKIGFESGELKGTLFADVPDALRRWSAEAKVAIYSSGSVEAQRLVFQYSIFGDLTGLIAAYFDTRTGPKRGSASYAAIMHEMEVMPGEAMFFSDVVKELDAAREAGCGTRLVVRPGNAPVKDARGHSVISSLEAE